MAGFVAHVAFHLPVAAVATLIGALLCRFLPWRLGFVVVTALYAYYVVVVSIMGEGVAGIDHAGAYTGGVALTIGAIQGVRVTARAVRRARRPSDLTAERGLA